MAEAFKFNDDYKARYNKDKSYDSIKVAGISFASTGLSDFGRDIGNLRGNVEAHLSRYEITGTAIREANVAIDFYTGQPLTHDFENIQKKAHALKLDDNKFCKFDDLVEKGLAKNLDHQQLIKDGKAFEVTDWMGESQIYCSASAVPELTANQTLAFDRFVKQFDSSQFQLKPREGFASDNQYILENCKIIGEQVSKTPLADQAIKKALDEYNKYRTEQGNSPRSPKEMQETIAVAKDLFPIFLAKSLGCDTDIILSPDPKKHSLDDIKYGENVYNDLKRLSSREANFEVAGYFGLKILGEFEQSFDRMVDRKLERENAIVSKEEPTKAEPQKQEPTKAEQAPAEPAKAEPQKQEPTKAEQAPAEPAKAEPQKQEPTKAEQAPAEPAKAEPQKQEPTKAEQAPAEPAKAEPQKQEPTKAEQAPAEPAKAEPQKQEPTKAEQAPAEPAKAEPQKQEPTKAEQAPAEQAKAQPQKQEPAKAEQAKTLSGRIDEAKAYTIQAYRKIIEPFKQLTETMNKSRVMVAVNEHFKSLAKSLSTDKQQSAQKNTPEVKQQSKAKDMER